jgi:hypothetical protein
MGATDDFEVVEVVELESETTTYFFRHTFSEETASSSSVDGPGVDVFGVGPQKVTERAFLRDLDAAVEEVDLVQGLHLRREACVHAEEAAIHDLPLERGTYGSDSKEVKDFHAIFPRVRVAVLAHDLVIKAVHLREGGGLTLVICRDSWFPRSNVTFEGYLRLHRIPYFTLNAKSSWKVSTE